MVRDSTQATAEQQFSITIAAITVTTFYLPTTVIAVPYSVQLTATGGSGGPYQWSYYFDGGQATVFGDFSGTEDGTITGTPAVYLSTAISVVALDPVTRQQSLPQSLVLLNTACPITVSPTALPTAEVGLRYSQTFSFTVPAANPAENQCIDATYGKTSVRTTGANLPPGIELDTNGTLTGTLDGTPLVPGTFQTAAIVTAYGQPQSQIYPAAAEFPLSLTIVPAPAITTATALPPGLLGAPYALQVAATSGVPPYVFSISNIPPGITMTRSGLLSGTPAQAGTYSINIGITDSLGGQSESPFQLTVTAATPQLQVPTSALTFTAPAGGDAPPSQTIDVTPAEGALLPDNFQVLVDGGQANTPAPSWLTLNTSAGSAPTRLVVSASQTNLAIGSHSARIQTIDSNGIHNAIPVTLTVTDAAPKIAASPAILRFVARAGQPETLVQNVIVNNSGGGGPISFSASVAGAASWISSVTPASNQTTANVPVFLQVQVNTQGLQVGSYHDSIQVASAAGNISIPVSLFVGGSGPALGLSSTAALFQTVQDVESTTARNIEVLNVGDTNSTVNWGATLVSGSNWLIRLNDDCGAPVTNGKRGGEFLQRRCAAQLGGRLARQLLRYLAARSRINNMVVTLNATSGTLQPAAAQLYGGIAPT
jgi:hypothetical protein